MSDSLTVTSSADVHADPVLNRARGATGDFDSGVFSSDDRDGSESRGVVNYVLRSSETVTEESETNSVFEDDSCEDQVFVDGEENPAFSRQYDFDPDHASAENCAKYELVKDPPEHRSHRKDESPRDTDDIFSTRVGSTLGGVVIKRGCVNHSARQLTRKSSSENLCPNCGLTNSITTSGSNCCEIKGQDINFSSTFAADDLLVIDSFRKLSHVQDVTTLSDEVKKNLRSHMRGRGEFKENICRCGYLGQVNTISDEKNIHLAHKMERSKNLTSIAYERDLAERTAQKPTRQELIKKQTLVRKVTERKSGIAKSHPTGTNVGNKDHPVNHVAATGKGSSLLKSSGEDEITRQQVFHTQSSFTTFSGTHPVTPEEARRKRVELRQHSLLRHETLDHEGSAASAGGGGYVAPLKKSQLEVRDLRNEVSQLSHEIDEKNVEIASLQSSLMAVEDKERQIVELEARIQELEKQINEEREPVVRLQEELAKMDERYTALKVEFAEKEEKFETYLLDMYKKGLEAARFEREEEVR
ncbi:unnamed protein product [Lymnaea stagnalis]|uniref:Uncharacterized protein n=1 Tax=Lymnaea stagnalis TaxID=6523 RepID=A0AAV2IBK8_LYMST